MSKMVLSIQIGKNVTSIMNLPCIYRCEKIDVDGRLRYTLFDWDECGNYKEAYVGDWLCKDDDGRWHVFSDEEYHRQWKRKKARQADLR